MLSYGQYLYFCNYAKQFLAIRINTSVMEEKTTHMEAYPADIMVELHWKIPTTTVLMILLSTKKKLCICSGLRISSFLNPIFGYNDGFKFGGNFAM